MEHSNHKQTGMLKNAAILFIAMAITKLIGAALKIPLTNILGGLGMGYFSIAYSLFSPIYAATAAALPTVIMRMVARNVTSGDFMYIRQVRRAGLFAALGLGTAGTIAILVISFPFSQYIADSPAALPAMLVIAPSLLFSSISAVYRGYFEGISDMFPTAISQIIEAVVKSTVGIVLATMVLIEYGETALPYAAAAAIAGITAGEMFGLGFLYLRAKFGKDKITAPASIPRTTHSQIPPERKRKIIKTIMSESMPITLAAIALNLNPFIDLMTIPTVINATIINNKAFFLQNFTYGIHGGESISDIGNFIYGSYTGIAIPIFAIATTITAMLGKSAFPEIASAWESNSRQRLARTLRVLFKGTFMVGFPLCFGLASLARPILSLLYFSKPAEVLVSTPPLFVLSLGGISIILAGTLFSIFLAIGRVDLQIKLILAGAAIKLGLNLALIRIPSINVTGAAISTVVSYTLVSIIGLFMLKRIVKTPLGIMRFALQPLAFSILCGFTAYVCNNYAFVERPAILNLAMSVAAGALAYLLPTMFTDRKYLKHFLPAKRLN
ncbi:MAG: polysaccharide biosynthesis C-terminal domain-containing protein [Oscillospiraceae bacterium]|nr:polysaccharide biosynthesis C-terminal domain-containing protein [Oscillospiraceae bacterium]